MAKKTASCTIASQRWSLNGSYTDYASGGAYAGWNSKNGYYVDIIKIKTPDYVGSSVSLKVTYNAIYVAKSSVTLRWALCTSDANKSSYAKTASSVTDSYQITNGTCTASNVTASGTDQTLTINAQTLRPSTTYYLYLWASSSSTNCLIELASINKHSASITYYEPYELVISAGTGSSIVVNRTSSNAGSTGKLSSGATIYHNDSLKITFTADTNYKILTSTVNDSSFTSGNTHTVTGGVTVKSTAQPLASGIAATDANIESTSTITITRYDSSYKHTVTYEFGNLTGTIAQKVSSTSIGWTIPTTFYAEMNSAKSKKCTITCETFDSGGKSLGTSSCKITVTTSKSICAPIVNGKVEDINDITISLTGDSATLIRYKSTARCTLSATAQSSATIKSTSINDTAVSNGLLEIANVSATSFEFSATDSRGYTSTAKVTPTVVPYIKLTINPTISRPSPTLGEIVLDFKGKFYNGSFGLYDNTLTIRYRYRLKTDSSYGSWKVISSSDYAVGSTSYYSHSSISLGTNFDYQESYVFQVQAYDGISGTQLTTVSSTITLAKGTPVFDWGKDDFNFNVSSLTVNDGNYIYNLLGAAKAMTTTYTMTCTATPGSNYSEVSCEGRLIGNCLRLNMSCTRNEAPSVGNITNEEVMTVTINHGGKIDYMYQTAFCNGPTGGVATFCSGQNTEVDSNSDTFTILLTGTTTSSTSWTGYWVVPVNLNLNAYV